MSELDGQAWTCRRCNQMLGVVRNGLLHVSVQVVLIEKARLRCTHCAHVQVWHPPQTESALGELKVV